MGNIKNTISNVIAFIVALGTVLATVFEEIPEGAKWYIWVGAAVVAIISYLTGKPIGIWNR